MKRLELSAVFLVAAMLFSHFLLVGAQTVGSEVIVTWRAENFYPSDYEGKALVTEGTPVTASAELVREGKLADISSANVKWYLNGRFLESGIGKKEISFIAKSRKGSVEIIKVVVELQGNSVTGLSQFTIQPKQIVLESSAPTGIISPNSSVSFSAVPYFFNITSLSDLNFSWRVDNKTIPGENENSLIVQFGTPNPGGTNTARVSAIVSEKPFSFEKARFDTLIRINQ